MACDKGIMFYIHNYNTIQNRLTMLKTSLHATFLCPWASGKHWSYYSYVLCLVAQSCPSPCKGMNCRPSGSSVHGDSPGKHTGEGCHALLQGVFPTQGLNLGLLHCRQILCCLSHQGSPRILEWVANPFSRGSFQSRNQTRVSCIAVEFSTHWATRKA